MAINPVLNNNINNVANLELFKKGQAKTVNPKMQGQAPNVGVVDVPELSKTPLMDTLSKRDEEIPKQEIKIKKKKTDKSIKLDILAISACVLGLVFACVKKVKKP